VRSRFRLLSSVRLTTHRNCRSPGEKTRPPCAIHAGPWDPTNSSSTSPRPEGPRRPRDARCSCAALRRGLRRRRSSTSPRRTSQGPRVAPVSRRRASATQTSRPAARGGQTSRRRKSRRRHGRLQAKRVSSPVSHAPTLSNNRAAMLSRRTVWRRALGLAEEQDGDDRRPGCELAGGGETNEASDRSGRRSSRGLGEGRRRPRLAVDVQDGKVADLKACRATQSASARSPKSVAGHECAPAKPP
jgi:hypothetical protein